MDKILITPSDMATIKKRGYLPPESITYSIYSERVLCTSPGDGGSEGTGDENLLPDFFGNIDNPFSLL